MAVVAKWMCDRDNTMFDTKKDADAYDKMLELGEQFTKVIEAFIPEIDEKQSEELGIFLSKNKEAVMSACKGSSTALTAVISTKESLEESEDDDSDDNVTPIKAEA